MILRWKRVVFSSECDEDGNCPHCGIDFADCGCPGPTMDEYEYREIRGTLFARKKQHSDHVSSQRIRKVD